ncbi:molybdopterin converting factor subunit 1 [Flavisphingomonas formosensis]|uniref:molybdopterin converting factor subunit 1 n=1 Tax=Flavisphingomonas formosensis TaxID=861534 RepID=UPI0012FCE9F0|nr:molybdopterin converting factor subunit 1 [Sphingomonas formosensis]
MPLELLYFAWVREAIGKGGESVLCPDGIDTVDSLIGWLAQRGGGYAEAFADRARLRAAVDQAFVPLDASIVGAREVALFPPVTGG